MHTLSDDNIRWYIFPVLVLPTHTPHPSSPHPFLPCPTHSWGLLPLAPGSLAPRRGMSKPLNTPAVCLKFCYRDEDRSSPEQFSLSLTRSLKLFITQMYDRSFTPVVPPQVHAEYKMHTCRTIIIYAGTTWHGRQVYPHNTDATCTVHWQN